MQFFLQQVVDGLASGAIYGALALAIVLILRSTGMLNFSQGQMAMFTTYIAWQLTVSGLNVWLAIPIALAIAFLIGITIERLLIRRMQSAPRLSIVMITLGLLLIWTSLAGFIWGRLTQSFPNPFPSTVYDVGGVRLSASSLGTLVVTLVVVIALQQFLTRTKLGLGIRAATSNTESSRLVGIPADRMRMLGWGLAAVLGGLAGVFVASRLFLDPNVMVGILVYAFAGATLGGFDSPGGAVLGGLIVGVAENLAGAYIGWVGGDLKIAVPFVLILAILLFRPNGLFGSKEVLRA